MRAMLLTTLGPINVDGQPLQAAELPVPKPAAHDVLIKVTTCGVCHTELDEIEGRTPPPKLPVVPGHQVVGRVCALGSEAGSRLRVGDRVGVAWIFSACGRCEYCLSERENLCPEFTATGRDANGGYAEYLTVPAAYAYRIPDAINDEHAAPLLCAGAVGYRALRLSGLQDGQALGLTGFGASAHLLLSAVLHRYLNTRIYVFARDASAREFALKLGATWAGATTDTAPEKLHCIIDTTPAWLPVVEALHNLRPGGRLVINAIGKEAGDQNTLLRLDYPEHLWREKEIKSVANVTRNDVEAFLQLAAKIPLRPKVQIYPLEQANQALTALKHQSVHGAKVLRINPE